MRPNGNKDVDAVIKSHVVSQLKDKYDVLFAIDDKDENCIVYQHYGIPTLKVISSGETY